MMNSDLVHSVLLIKPKRHFDNRGFFAEIYSSIRYAEIGVPFDFVQENHSLSNVAGTVRGLHYQVPPKAQAKLVRCGRGAIFDVAVDLRLGSPAFGDWQGFFLSAENGHQLYIPVGFAHGFLTLEPDSEIVYKCTDYYAPETEAAVRWDSCGIDWPFLGDLILSDRDLIAPAFADFASPFIYGENS